MRFPSSFPVPSPRTVIAILIGAVSVFLLPGLLGTLQHLAAGERYAGPLVLTAVLICGLYGATALYLEWKLGHLCGILFLGALATALLQSGSSESGISVGPLAFAAALLLPALYLVYDWVRTRRVREPEA